MKTLSARKTNFQSGILGVTLMLSSFASFAQSGGAIFEAGPTMMRAKIYPTSTLLPDGKVVSFGGREYNFVSCSYSDLYDPNTNTFSESPMNFPHDAGATVELSDGRYFLLGGGADLGIAPGYSSTEIYDPTSASFSPQASMTMGRMQLSAAQLNNGNVLVVGGWYNPSGAAYGEIYNFQSNTFVPTGTLNQPRSYPLVIPTTDGGAIIAGGWPTYGGSIYTSVEYYQTTTNDFVTVSQEVIPSDSGWVLYPIYTRPIADSRTNDGNYILLATRNIAGPEYGLIEFNPTTKVFSKINTDLPLMNSVSDGGFIDLVLNVPANLVYVLGVKAGMDPQQVALITVDLNDGRVYLPSTNFTLPSGEYFYPAMTYMPENGKILVQGINASNSSYFTGTNKTYLLTPDIQTGIGVTASESVLNIYPNPASQHLTISTKLSGEMTLTLSDMMGRTLKRESKQSYYSATDWDISGIENGIYLLSIEINQAVFSSKIQIKK